jgi:2-phosphosulfolactate phosphatase
MVEEAVYERLRQSGAAVRFDWGRSGALAIGEAAGCTVVVDVLSFTTAVSIAVGRGSAVYPYPLSAPGAASFAQQNRADLAVRRGETSVGQPWSLSPAGLQRAPFTPRLVLPSPNGSAIASLAEGVVMAACLRNAQATTEWALANGFGRPTAPVSVVASGELWPDGSLRPAVEDALGAGAVLHHLKEAGCGLSPEAAVMAGLFEATADLDGVVRKCATALELYDMGYEEDVAVALELDADPYASVKTEGAFRPPRPGARGG